MADQETPYEPYLAACDRVNGLDDLGAQSSVKIDRKLLIDASQLTIGGRISEGHSSIVYEGLWVPSIPCQMPIFFRLIFLSMITNLNCGGYGFRVSYACCCWCAWFVVYVICFWNFRVHWVIYSNFNFNFEGFWFVFSHRLIDVSIYVCFRLLFLGFEISSTVFSTLSFFII